MKNICLAWMDTHDLNYVARNTKGHGPIISLLETDFAGEFDEFHILINTRQPLGDHLPAYLELIKKKFIGKAALHTHDFNINPAGFNEIYVSVTSVIEGIKKRLKGKDISWRFHMSPGTSQMSAMWLLLAKTSCPAILYQSHFDRVSGGSYVKTLDFPFNLDLEYIPETRKKSGREVSEYLGAAPGYEKIIHDSDVMRDTLRKAHKIALHDVPVLILGETGTGKELFANAIHADSSRSGKMFGTLNCSAIHENTAIATLFGWSKGAWTDGPKKDDPGIFKKFDGGTVFLDEIGDLSLETQTKLLRFVQHGEVQRVGDGAITHANVRLICATHKDLMKLVAEGKFREDLYYRIGVFILELPPLRSRGKDIIMIAEKILGQINAENLRNERLSGYEPRKLSIEAKKLIMRHRWPGNVRELYNTLQRVCVWGESVFITDEELKEYITSSGREAAAAMPANAPEDALAEGERIDLDALTDDFRKKFIIRALELAEGNRTEASKMLGYKNYQTLTNEMKRMGLI